jgi:hypothetical protein
MKMMSNSGLEKQREEIILNAKNEEIIKDV